MSGPLKRFGQRRRSAMVREGGMNDKFDKFTNRARIVMALAQDEAQRLGHNYMGTEHLLLGLLREEQSIAFTILNSFEMRLDDTRDQLRQLLEAPRAASRDEDGFTAGAFDRLNLIDRIRRLVDRLEHAAPGSAEAREAIDHIRRTLDTLS